jgi:hypothetical protein
MSLLEIEQRRSRRAQRTHRKQIKRRKKKRSALEAPLPLLLCERQLQDDQVLSFRQWCALNGFSERTGRRILTGECGPPPTVTMLTDTRIGITVGNNRAWQASRARGVDRPSGDRFRRGRQAQERS